MKTMLFLMILGALPAAGKGPMVYSGEWKNTTANTHGPLSVTVIASENDGWDVRFDGFMNDSQFSYDVIFKSVEENGETSMQGRADVAGEQYRLSCWMSATSFHGRFTSDSGAQGDLRLSIVTREN